MVATLYRKGLGMARDQSKLTLWVPTSLKHEFKAKVAMDGRNMSQVVSELIEAYIKKKPK